MTGEQVFRLEGLDTGAQGSGPSSSEAVALFVERAQAAAPVLSPDAVEVAVIGGICRQLDGLPLAIELAAARAGILSVAEIAARLQDPGLLRHPSRTAPSRHLTMDAVLEWSHRLLRPLEQTLFVRLSVFQGSFSLLAAESVASGGDIEAKEVLPLLSALVDRSLVQVVERRADNRYRMLRTIRAYGEARLAASPDSAAVWQAHSDFFAGLALQGQVGLEVPIRLDGCSIWTPSTTTCGPCCAGHYPPPPNRAGGWRRRCGRSGTGGATTTRLGAGWRRPWT